MVRKRISVVFGGVAVQSVHLTKMGDVDVGQDIVAVAEEAVRAAGFNGMAAVLREADLVGRLRAQLRSFAKGMLPEGRDGAFEPVVTQPDLWELRVKDQRLGLFRIYYGEPPDRFPEVVVLLVHRKRTDNLPSDVVARQQNMAMLRAQERYRDGYPCRWGHLQKNCPSCIEL